MCVLCVYVCVHAYKTLNPSGVAHISMRARSPTRAGQPTGSSAAEKSDLSHSNHPLPIAPQQGVETKEPLPVHTGNFSQWEPCRTCAGHHGCCELCCCHDLCMSWYIFVDVCWVAWLDLKVDNFINYLLDFPLVWKQAFLCRASRSNAWQFHFLDT